MSRSTFQPPAAPTGSCAGVVRHDDAVLAEIADEWEALWARCRAATPFQAPAWQTSWWREYGRPGELRMALVRRDGQLVAVGGFHRSRPGVLAPLGVGLSDWTDVLVDPEHEADALGALAAALLAGAGWQVLDLPEVRAGAVALRWAQHWPGPVRTAAGSVCGDIAAAPLDDVVAAMSSSARQSVRRSLRRMDGAGLVEEPVAAADVAAAVDELLALHHEQWRERGGMNPEHGRPRFARHLRAAVQEMVGRGQAALIRYRVGEELVAANLVLAGGDVVGGYLFGARPALFKQFNVMSMLMRTALTTSAEHGVSTFSMLRGREAYKSEWGAEEAGNTRLLLGRPGRPAAPAYAGVVRARTALIALARTHAPAVRELALQARTYARNPSLLRRRSARRDG